MPLPNFTTYAPEDLEEARVAIANEIERRERLEQAPLLIKDMARRFIEDGGDAADMTAAVDAAVQNN